MKIPEGLKCEITPEMAYPKGVPEIPDGYEFVRFGKPTAGELCLTEKNWVVTAEVHTLPYIIVRKKPQPPPRQWVVQFEAEGARLDFAPGHVPFNLGVSVVREAKPITRQQVDDLARRVDDFISSFLRELGIRVED